MRCPECNMILTEIGSHWRKHASSRQEFEKKYPQIVKNWKKLDDIKKTRSFESSYYKPYIAGRNKKDG